MSPTFLESPSLNKKPMFIRSSVLIMKGFLLCLFIPSQLVLLHLITTRTTQIIFYISFGLAIILCIHFLSNLTLDRWLISKGNYEVG